MAGVAVPRLTALLPRGLAFQATPGDDSTYVPEERRVHWPLPALQRGVGRDREFRFRLRLDDDAPDLMVQRLQLWGQGFEGAAEGEVLIKRRFPPTEAVVTPGEGGELRSGDGRVRVIFPAGAVTESLRVEHRPKRVDRLPAQSSGMALEFELNAATDDAAAAPVHRFAKPLELRVNAAGLLDWGAMPYWEYAQLVYLDEEKGTWVPLPTRREGDELIATLDHFSTIGMGTEHVHKAGWLFVYNEPGVDLFSGGLTYDYPIQVPEGRGGLTPDVRLSYNSRRVDGILSWIQTDWLGLGWSVDQMEIVRYIKASPARTAPAAASY